MTTQITGEVIPSDKPGSLAMAIRQPVGVVLGIAPWNAPVILGVRAIAMPLACGNTVVLKASEMCPGTHRADRHDHARGGPAARRRQCRHQRAGRCREDRRGADRASGGAAHQLHRLDAGRADHRRDGGALPQAGAARTRRQGAADRPRRRRPRRGGEGRGLRRFANMGQICMSTERIVVDEKVADAFVEKFAAKARALPHGDPRGHVVLGSLVTQGSGDAHKELIDDAVVQGREGRRRRRVQRHGHAGDGARPRDACDAHLRARSPSGRSKRSSA